MNVIFVSKECPPSPQSCGIGTYVWETGRALGEMGHNVTIIAASDDGRLTSSMPSVGLTVIRLPDDESAIGPRSIVARTLSAPRKQAATYRRRVAECIADLVDNRRPDVIEFPGFRGESIMWQNRPRSVPMVVRMHGATGRTNEVWKDRISATRRLQLGWEREEVAAADLITVVSEHQASVVRAQFGADRVKVLHNSIDADQWRKYTVKTSRGVDRSDVLFVGSLLTQKGVFVLLRAAKLLRQTGWRGRLVLAGRTTPQFERIIRIRAILGMNLPDWIVYLGVCRRDRLAGLYRDSGACCFPSLVDPFPYTCLEAMACGGLVVGSSRTGMAEMVTEACGFLVPPGDVSRLVAALKSALSMSDEERRQMKNAAQERVHSHFDNDVIIPKLLNIYNETIDSCRTRC